MNEFLRNLRRIREQSGNPTKTRAASRQDPNPPFTPPRPQPIADDKLVPVAPPLPSLRPRDRRGRPRKTLRHQEVSDATPLLELWFRERVAPAPSNLILLGEARRPARHGYVTLRDDFRSWLGQHQRAVVMPKSFTGHVLRLAIAAGWPAHRDKTAQRRRVGIRGLTLIGAPAWDGNDRDLAAEAEGRDRKRWIPKSKSGQT